MRNTVEKVSNEGSRVRFLLFTTIATTSTAAAAAAASNPKMPHHTMSQGTLNKRRLRLKIARLDFAYLTQYHPMRSFSESDQGPSNLILWPFCGFSNLSQEILAQDGRAALYCIHQMAKALACRRCISLGLLQRLCI